MSLYLVICIVSGSLPTAVGYAGDVPPGENGSDATPPLIQQMIGTWDVWQRMWLGAAGNAVELPPAVAHRVLIGNTILQEVMTLASESSETPFTRVAYYDYNAVTRRYEYFSLDTRAAQMMNERSLAVGTQDKSQHRTALTLLGVRFVAPQWGDATNVAFHY